QMTEALREREEFLNNVIEYTPNPIWVADEKGTIIRMNQALRDLLKVADEEIIGKYNVLKDSQVREQGFLPLVRSVFEEGRTVRFTMNYYTAREKQVELARKTHRVLEIVISAVKDREGKVFNAICQQNDVTERERAEEALRDSEKKFRNLFENSADAISITSPEGRILDVNRAWVNLFGYSYEEALKNLPVSHVYASSIDRDKFQKVLEETGLVRDFEVKMHKRDGTAFDCTMSSVVDYDDKGNIRGYQNIVRDITDRRKAEQQSREMEILKQVDRMRSEFLANVSHELRTPLTAIKGYTSTLLREDVSWKEAEQREFLKIIDAESDRLTRLISDLLDMSLLEAGKMAMKKGQRNISDAINAIRPRLDVLCATRRLTIDVPANLPQVNIDEMRIGQVISNLVDNAVKHSPEGSEIAIRAELVPGKEIIVSINDHGEGISRENLSKLFNRFVQLEEVSSGKKKGTGLGLAISRGIIENHGGRIWAESESRKGSKFIFTLPLP
ncbi:MAG: PAS domain S-box protein, partial [Dehalococcoidales bacterium]|nr:PAS domain S-box protein [Dehalococcoidales bacterium]